MTEPTKISSCTKKRKQIPRLILGLWLASCPLATTAHNSPVKRDGDRIQPADSHAAIWFDAKESSPNALGVIHIPSRITGTGREWRIKLTLIPVSRPITLAQPRKAISSSSLSFSNKSPNENKSIFVQPTSTGRDSFQLDIRAERISLSGVSFDAKQIQQEADSVSVPYYAPIYYATKTQQFINVYLDWNHSNATRISGTDAIYEPLTNGTRNPVVERLVIKVSPRADDVFPDIENPKSPFLSAVSGRTVIDIPSAPFAEIATTLTRLREAGLGHCVVIIHSWTAKGYDNAYPDHAPASDSLGGDSNLQRLTIAARQSDCYLALHENFVDYYPNYSHFTKSDISLSSDGKPENGWLNRSTALQAFYTKPTTLATIAAAQSAEIAKRYHTNAAFVDVNSSVVPWWKVDMDANVAGAGMFSTFIEASKRLWASDRQTYNGPVFGEGENHWFWSGLLDGVEAQLSRGAYPGGRNVSAQLPLFVDFDLLKIHPLQANHGMGYYERWLNNPESIHETKYQDAYRMQEIAFGHAPFVGKDLWRSEYHMLQEQSLVGPLAQRYGTATVKSIQYEVNGKWTTTEDAIRARDWSRVAVHYSNGDTIIANANTEELQADRARLPQYGWIATGKNLLAYTAYRGGVIADYSDTGEKIFANARNKLDIPESTTTQNLSASPTEPADNRINAGGDVVDFESIRTDGTISIEKRGQTWKLRSHSNGRRAIIRLNVKRFPIPKLVVCELGLKPQQQPAEEDGYWQIEAMTSRACYWQ